MKVGDNTSGEKNYAYWTAIVVENENSKYVVKQISPADGTPKTSLRASGNGFILLFHENNVSADVIANVGDTVTLSSDFWKTTYSYNNGTVYGTVTFSPGTSTAPKPEKDNSSQLTKVQGADTNGLIEVNLYDYGTNINDMYNNNPFTDTNHKADGTTQQVTSSRYPGFQQEYGSWDVGEYLSK